MTNVGATRDGSSGTDVLGLDLAADERGKTSGDSPEKRSAGGLVGEGAGNGVNEDAIQTRT